MKLSWKELTDEEQTQAISNYIAVREHEEGIPCSVERAIKETPYCRCFYKNVDGSIEVDI